MRTESNDLIVSVYAVRNNFVKTMIGECTSTTFGLACHVSLKKSENMGDPQDNILIEKLGTKLCASEYHIECFVGLLLRLVKNSYLN